MATKTNLFRLCNDVHEKKKDFLKILHALLAMLPGRHIKSKYCQSQRCCLHAVKRVLTIDTSDPVLKCLDADVSCMASFIELIGVLRGLEKVGRAAICLQQRELQSIWMNSSLQPIVHKCSVGLEETASDFIVAEMPKPCNDTKEFTDSNSSSNVQSSSSTFTNFPSPSAGFSPVSNRSYHTSAALQLVTSSVRQKDISAAEGPPVTVVLSELESEVKKKVTSQLIDNSASVPQKKKSINKMELSKRSKERKVPGTRVERLMSFGSLGAGLAMGALAEATKRGLGLSNSPDEKKSVFDGSFILNEANASRIVDTLCKVRGAALKLGQMLSIQDNSFISPELQQLFERVRQSADFMPAWQMEKILVKDFGSNWRDKFQSFEMKPFAAASIGQVHKATLHDGRQVAVKIQYPGVAESINSDINNIVSLLKVWQVLPPGLYADQALKVARRELAWECDYIREAQCSERFRDFLKDDPAFYVPKVSSELSTKNVLTTELINGESLDKFVNADQELRNWISKNMLRLCLDEVFKFSFMQTDPNWSNFLYDSDTKRIMLIDFGSSREYSKKFTDSYLQIIKSASLNDRQGIKDASVKLGFLTGYESQVMQDAHTDAVLILGEAFAKDETFDFGQQSTASRIHRLVPVMLKHRLSPPPEETYSLHRKMAGCFLLCAKLRAQINCKPMFDAVYEQYQVKQSQR